MPLYDVQHAVPLTLSQQDDLAEAITRIHSEKFTTPRMFVNVRFTPVSPDAAVYVGGVRKVASHIVANVRAGPSRTQADWNELCRAVEKAWDNIVPLPKVRRSEPDQDTSLRSVIILGDITAGVEAGFALPPAGGDVDWLRENFESFQEKAKAGDQEFVQMVKEIEERGLLKPQKTAAQQLEEMLGWGDSA